MIVRNPLAVHARKFWWHARTCRRDEPLANRVGSGHALRDIYQQTPYPAIRARIEAVGAFMNRRAHERGDDRAVIEANT